jgi:glycosidase
MMTISAIKFRSSIKLAKFICLFLISAAVNAGDYTIKHLEPLSWWVGMQHPELQLMVHGDNISSLTPEINYAGVTLVNTEKSDNKNYLFINLKISDAAKPGIFTISFKEGDKVFVKANYRLDARAKNSAQRIGFSAKDAIYLLVPDRFANSNPANDSRPDVIEVANRNNSNGRHGGDIQGMQKQLDYIAGLGFTMIWPTPLIQNNQKEYSYHGYSLTDHYKIDSRFGSNEDFKNYVIAANKKGVGVIQDIVLNHIGSGHWWMQDLPAEDWLNFQAGFVPTNHQHTTALDLHAAKEDRKFFTEGWFVDTMPDLNQRNPFLAKYLIQNTLWWIEYANLSGVREDTYSYSDKDFLAAWGKYILEEYPNFNMVGEEMNSNPQILAYWQKDVKNRDGYQSWLPSLMDFPVVFLMPSVLNDKESYSSGFIKLYEMIANDFVYADPMKLVVFPDNHDTSRMFSLLHDDINLLKNSLVFTATIRGIPQIYYGTEILAKSPIERNDGIIRSDMPGGWPGDNINAFTGKGLSVEQKDIQKLVKTLFNWRKTNDAITEGKLIHFVPENSTYVYFRYTDSKTVMIVLNKNPQNVELNLARYQEIIKGKVGGTDILTGTKIDLSKPLALRGMTPVVIEL